MPTGQPLICTITKAGKFDTYGLPLVVGQSYSLDFNFVKSLYQQGYATVANTIVFDDDNNPSNSANPLYGSLDTNGNPIGIVNPKDGSTFLAWGAKMGQLERATVKLATKTLGRLFAFGDSITNGLGSTNATTKSYRALLNARYIAKLPTSINLSVTGAIPGSYFNNASTAPNYQFVAGDICFCQFGLNSVINNNGAPLSPVYYNDLLKSSMSSLAWFAVPESAKVRAHDPLVNTNANPAVTFAGAWTHNYSVYSTIASYGNGAGTSTATFTTPAGNCIYVWMYRTAATGQGTFNITIDGVVYVGETSGLSYSAATGGFEPTLLRYNVPYAASHTVQLALVSGSYIFTAGVACFTRGAVDGATVLAMLPTDLPQAGYTQQSSYAITTLTGNGTTSTATTSFAHMLTTGDLITVANASVAGFNVASVAVTVTSSTTFTYLSTGTPSATGATYTAPAVIGGFFTGTGALQRLNQVTRQAIENLFNDGLNVVCVEPPVNHDPAIHVVGNASADSVHDNDNGYYEKYIEFSKSMDRLLGIASA
jgi:lysophospholipase L1-like esterase